MKTLRQRFGSTRPQSSVVRPVTMIFALSTIVLSGCGGGGSSSSTPPTPVDLTQPKTQLNAVVRGTTSLTTANLTPIVAQFDSARQADSTNKDAQFGYAISEAALASAQFATAIGATLPAANTKAAASSTRLLQLGQVLRLWNIANVIRGGQNSALPQVSDLVQVNANSTSPTAAQVQTALASLDASLAKVEQALNVDLSSSSYVATLADPNHPTDTTKTVKLGTAEFRILLAAVNGLRAVCNIGTAYNATVGTFNFNASISTVFPNGLQQGQEITPAQYMPTGSFATLTSTGKTNLATTKTELTNLANNGVAAIESFKTRTSTGYLIDPGNVVTTTQLNDAEITINKYKAYLTGTQTVQIDVNGTTQSLAINLGGFLSNPPTDLKALEPTYTVMNAGSGFYTLSTAASSYPDHTFGGLFPNGVPINGVLVDVSSGDPISTLALSSSPRFPDFPRS